MIHDPQVLILDEPTIGLDPAQIREIRELIRGLRGEHTILLSTHILPEVTQVCDGVIIINEGRLMASGSLADLPPPSRSGTGSCSGCAGAGPRRRRSSAASPAS